MVILELINLFFVKLNGEVFLDFFGSFYIE